MQLPLYSYQDLVHQAQFSSDEMAKIRECRHEHTRLGFAYQLAFLTLYRRSPAQQPLELIDGIVTYVSLQVGYSG